MPLYATPVRLSYRLAHGAGGAMATIQVNAVATAPAPAQAIATALVDAQLRIRFGAGSTVDPDMTRVGQPGAQVTGIYAYLIGRGNAINHLTFPARIEQSYGQELDSTLNGVDPKQVLGCVMDLVHLAYINSSGLAAFANHSPRLHIHFMRPPPAITKVLQMTGLDRMLPIHADLPSALNALAASYPQPVG